MKKILAVALGALSLGGAAGVSLAAPGPNGSNHHGLCTAYFNGSETGRAHKRNAGPFTALETAASDDDDATTPTEDVWVWCSDLENNPKGIGGQPEDPTTAEAEGNGKNSRGKG